MNRYFVRKTFIISVSQWLTGNNNIYRIVDFVILAKSSSTGYKTDL